MTSSFHTFKTNFAIARQQYKFTYIIKRHPVMKNDHLLNTYPRFPRIFEPLKECSSTFTAISGRLNLAAIVF